MVNFSTQRTHNTLKPSWVLGWFLAPLPLFLPLSFLNLVTLWASTDSLFYVNILKMMTGTLHAGVIFPRWLGEANDGFGSPVMIYYAPLAYIITAIINLPLQLLNLSTVCQFLIGIYASQVVSGLTAFIWLKNSFSRGVAYVGSLLFILLPYKFIYLYGHVNLAQLWALAALPPWMLAAEKMVQGDRRSIGLYALMLAAVYFTHSLTVLAFGWVPACYVLWFGRKKWLGNYAKLVLANILGLAICAMQILPQHYAFAWIHVEEFLAGRFNWSNNIYHVDIVICGYYGLLALIGAELWQNKPLRTQRQVREGIMWAWVMGVVLFMVTPLSSFIWARITLLQFLQFPCARFHAVALMGVIYLLCCWLTYYDELLPKARLIYSKTAALVVVLLFSVITLAHLYAGNAEPNDLNSAYIENMHGALVIPSPEYRTSWECIPAPDVARMYVGHTIPMTVNVPSGSATISALQWQPLSNINFVADVKSANADITVRQCYFPLWQARDEAGHNIVLKADDKHGLITFNLPEGSHKISLHFALSPVEQRGRMISSVALAISLAILMVRRKTINS